MDATEDRPVVLVIDDEAAVRRLLRDVLAEQGFTTELAGSGEEGIDIYQRLRPGVDAVLLDVQLGGGLDGPNTLAALRGIDPDVVCCFMTGNPGRYTFEELRSRVGHSIIHKPIHFEVLRETLSGAIRRPRAPRRPGS